MAKIFSDKLSILYIFSVCFKVFGSLTLFLPPATKLGQGNIFRSVCQEFCPQGVSRPRPRVKVGGRGQVSRPRPRGKVGGSGWGVSRPRPREEVGGLARRGVSRPRPRGQVGGSGQVGVNAHTWGGPGPHPGSVQAQAQGGVQAQTHWVSRPRPRGCILACNEAEPPPPSRRLLLRVVSILLECILVNFLILHLLIFSGDVSI